MTATGGRLRRVVKVKVPSGARPGTLIAVFVEDLRGMVHVRVPEGSLPGSTLGVPVKYVEPAASTYNTKLQTQEEKADELNTDGGAGSGGGYHVSDYKSVYETSDYQVADYKSVYE